MPDPIAYRPRDMAHQAPYASPGYGSTRARSPSQPLFTLPHTLTETSSPRFTSTRFPARADLTVQTNGTAAMGERIIVAGRVLDEDGRPVRGAMVEVWQANAAGRYNHPGDQHDAPLDPAFDGAGRVFADDDGWYRFQTVRPGAYPWGNHHNAWRPNHIHFSLFGAGIAQRMITQMYFPGDPLLPIDPIFNAIPSEAGRNRLVSAFDLALTEPSHAIGYRFDIVLRGHAATPMEDPVPHEHHP